MFNAGWTRTSSSLACVAAFAVALVAAPPARALVGPATHGFTAFGGQGLCLNASGSAGAQIATYGCSAYADWTPRRIGNNFALSPSMNLGLCLDVQGGSLGNHVPLVLEPCNGSRPTQNWYVQNGAIWNMAVASNTYCVGLPSNSSGALAEVESCNGSSGQLFWPFGMPLIINSDLSTGGVEECISNRSNGTTMSDALCSQTPTPAGEELILGQNGSIQEVGNTSECLTVNGISNFFSSLSMEACGAAGQQFYLSPASNQFLGWYWPEIRSSETYYGYPECVDIQGANPNPNNQVDLYYCNNTNAQAWGFVLLFNDYQ